jgi:hypothetical protein
MSSRACWTWLVILGVLAATGMASVFLHPRSPASVQRMLARMDSERRAELTRRPAAVAGEARSEGGQGLAEEQEEEERILVARTEGPLPLDDPLAPGWDQAPVTAVPLAVQDQTMPVLESLAVPAVRVSGLTDGRQIAWRLSWDDAAADTNVDTARFCDAAAVQLPLDAGAAYTMGVAGSRVQIIYWKALWQKDVDEHFQDVQDLYPNYWSDLYWFAEGKFPYPVPASFQRPESQEWLVGWRAGNPMADFHRREPVQELIAEGFGTLTHQPESASTARGVWKDGRWSVVFGRPLRTDDASDYQFDPGARDVVAFALWDGSSGNVGGRHQQSLWVVFEVER